MKNRSRIRAATCEMFPVFPVFPVAPVGPSGPTKRAEGIWDASFVKPLSGDETRRFCPPSYRWLLHFRDCFTFATVNSPRKVRGGICHHRVPRPLVLNGPTQASTWLLGLASPSRPDLTPPVGGQRMFPAPRMVSGFTSCEDTFARRVPGTPCELGVLVQQDASASSREFSHRCPLVHPPPCAS